MSKEKLQGRDAFMAECMDAMKAEGKPHKQCVAICINKWVKGTDPMVKKHRISTSGLIGIPKDLPELTSP